MSRILPARLPRSRTVRPRASPIDPTGPTVPVLRPLRDRIRPGVRILFVGINPGIRSALTGHHFAGFSNRFWKLLYESGLVPEHIGYQDDGRLLEWGYGITNIVARPTPGIDTLRPQEYVEGRLRLRRKVSRNCRVWRAEHFSWWMTSMLHRFHDDTPFQHRLQLAELDYVTNSRAKATTLAENYVGLPLEA